MSATTTKKIEIHISTGASRFEKKWKNRTVTWDELAKRLARSQKTGETHAEYMAASKARQDQIKDIGGFVGGWLKDGRRLSGNVMDRSVVTLDADFINGSAQDFVSAVQDAIDFTDAIIYGTHKNAPDKPRLRLVVCLSRPVSPEEYEAIARKIADKIGMTFFDSTTFQASRLMYWPSHSSDIEPFYQQLHGCALDADAVLAEYPDWTDVSFWPSAEGEEIIPKRAEHQADPLEKKGVVGTFCRAYDVPAAISAFLSDIYSPGTNGRYTYIKGSTHNGLVVYGDGKWAYSNHATDPASMQLCNSFDLVRIHKFGQLDTDPEKTGAAAPSYKAMLEFAVEQDGYKQEYFAEKQADAKEDFSASAEEQPTDDSWKSQLIFTQQGLLARLMQNINIILENDPKLKGCLGYNELSGIVSVRKKLPWGLPAPRSWTDADDAQLLSYIEQHYGVMPKQYVCDAVVKLADDHRFNPIKEYLEGLRWDRTPRVDTMLVDYLGAEDTPYTRAVTRNTMVACVRRIYEPGVKFDYMLVLVGKTGIGKSTLWAKLAGDWFSDSLSLDDMRDKTAAEKLQGFWILEIGEMQGARRADVNNVKSFLSRQSDNYRASYGRYVTEHPRSSIIVGTTNELDGFLKDLTGNRRFWPVKCYQNHQRTVWDLDEETVGQIWAEAVQLNKKHEPLNLSEELEQVAAREQQSMLESDDRFGAVQEYLDVLLPAAWYDWPIDKRIEYFQTEDDLREKGTMRRDRVCAMEIWTECFGGRIGSYDSYRDGRTIGSIMAKMEGWEKPDNPARIKGYGLVRIWEREALPRELPTNIVTGFEELPF
jgi:predicted P-loop ATPase